MPSNDVKVAVGIHLNCNAAHNKSIGSLADRLLQCTMFGWPTSHHLSHISVHRLCWGLGNALAVVQLLSQLAAFVSKIQRLCSCMHVDHHGRVLSPAGASTASGQGSCYPLIKFAIIALWHGSATLAVV